MLMDLVEPPPTPTPYSPMTVAHVTFSTLELWEEKATLRFLQREEGAQLNFQTSVVFNRSKGFYGIALTCRIIMLKFSRWI